ncbi:MAG TPA: SIMPL domain-containing protein [Hyphomonadaceae bacterium]|nr:SIMPL domain-containing protein [Hyphomonadaceae bacterium]
MKSCSFAAVTCLALATAPVAIAQNSNELQKETTLVLRGEGSVDAKPDYANITIGVSIEQLQAVDAINEENKQMTAVIAAIKKSGVVDRDVRTSNLSLAVAYQPFTPNQPQRVRGYTASNRVTVKVRDTSKLSSVVDAVVSAGSNTISGLSFGLDNDEQQRKQARTDAIKDATDKANDYAAAMGYRVKRIVNVTEAGVPSPVPIAQQNVVSVYSSQTPIEPGQVSIRQAVNVMFELTK